MYNPTTDRTVATRTVARAPVTGFSQARLDWLRSTLPATPGERAEGR